MSLIGLMPVRNEDWILGLSARVALIWCDSLVILNHASTDGTARIIADLCNEFPERVTVLFSCDQDWAEMQHRQMMLDAARGNGATHIAIVDADELLTANLLPTIRQHIDAVPGGWSVQLPGYNLRKGLDLYHYNGIWGNGGRDQQQGRWFSVAFKDDPRLGWSGDKFHSREPSGLGVLRPYRPVRHGNGGVLHLWGANERRLIAKHALMKCVERVRFPDKPVAEIDKMYSWAIKGEPGHRTFGTPESWTYADVPASWTAPYADLMRDHLRLDAEPWQEAECRRLIAEHGHEPFEGLDLFGVA